MVPMAFYGDSSSYKELPKPEEIYDYERYKTPFWTKDTNINRNNVKPNSTFII